MGSNVERASAAGRGRRWASRAAAAVVLVGIAVYLVPAAVAVPPSVVSTKSECVPIGNRFRASWETVAGAPGEVAREFGTLTWTRTRLDYDIRAGYLVQLCLASVDARDGITFVAVEGRRGPRTGSWPFPDFVGITEVGFGVVEIPATVGTGVLPPTGVGVTVRMAGVAVGAVLAGWWLTRTGRGVRSDPGQA